ncbi:MAG TPA: nuclear transport factor 2 family protein [Gemmatimonadaceae bacterium]|nr:nuclear transport factor 2 family protein [Gemmatimonadaceae bacterium]
MRIASLALLALALDACASTSGSAPDPSTARTIALSLLDRGARSWNRGDLDAFMSDYVDGPRTSFVTNLGVMHGRAEIRQRYAPRFAPGGVRDSLSFEGVEADPIGPDAVHVIAWYKLMRGDSLIARGPTSLVLMREAGQWRILKDHSS